MYTIHIYDLCSLTCTSEDVENGQPSVVHVHCVYMACCNLGHEATNLFNLSHCAQYVLSGLCTFPCVCVLSSSGGVQFCSATYRLFKVPPSEQCRDTDRIMEVQYKGRCEGRGGGNGRR